MDGGQSEKYMPWTFPEWKTRASAYRNGLPEIRLEIPLNANGDVTIIITHRCEACGEYSAIINVHHVVYESGRKYHDYPDSALLGLCPDCHMSHHGLTIDQVEWVWSGIIDHEVFGEIRCDNCDSELRYGHILEDANSGLSIEVGKWCAERLTTGRHRHGPIEYEPAPLRIPDKSIGFILSADINKISFSFHDVNHRLGSRANGIGLTAYGVKGKKEYSSIPEVADAFFLAQIWAISRDRVKPPE
ncbi:hypothetical protein [Photobacterium angustum]|uniref:hypothetical protein n=1 Tax=Photobacterium angustum TaxID=661 RepID=UPI0005DC0F9E|nr:hypothetical protein [Photobacterium angustum]KJG00103.1 hypothetical protein UB35_19825 [Photobacterium angustum]PSV61704.1 hypothetical protein CTM95_20595 [Photobacterium angustum]